MVKSVTIETLSDIFNRMAQTLPPELDCREGTFTHDALRPVAMEIQKNQYDIRNLVELNFIETSGMEYLDKKAQEVGLERKDGTVASGTVSVTTGRETPIPSGTIFSTNDNIQFISLEDIVVNGTMNIYVRAIDIGSKYNVPKDAIVTCSVSVDKVLNEPMYGGSDRETDEQLKMRLFQRVQNPPGGGNQNDYHRWCREIDGVEYTKVVPLWDGPGTVKVVVGSKDGSPLSIELFEKVREHIDNYAPIGASVTMNNVQQLPVNITANIEYDNEYKLDDIRKNIEANLDSYLLNRKPSNRLMINEIGSIIINTAGVIDYSTVLINGSTGNMTTTDEQKPVLQTVVIGG